MKDPTYRPQYDNSWALVIGIDQYRYANPLDFARADAESVAEVLVAELGFPTASVCKLLDGEATRSQIMERFLAFESLSPDDRLFVFFAGHGHTVPGQRGPVGYLVPVDGRLEDKSALIRWDELTRNAEIIPAKHILFVMDACYSGLAMQRAAGVGEQRFVSDMLQRLSRQVITAGKADETVSDGGGPSGKNSIFTGHLLEGLRGKAANEKGVLTASYLMNYVYQNVGNDPRSNQTPHFGHLDGDGDFILRTPNGEHLSGGPAGDFLVHPVLERPEPPSIIPLASVKPVFAEKNGYADPESDSFGRNGWSRKLGYYESRGGTPRFERPFGWLSLVVEPVSNQPVDMDIAGLAKTLPNSTQRSNKPYEQFTMPARAITTAKSLIIFDSDRANERSDEEYWERFLRIEKNGAIEYCDCVGVAHAFLPMRDAPAINIFRYVKLIGLVWTFLYAARRILSLADYQAGIRYLVNVVGTKDSVLIDFASQPGEDGQRWPQPLEDALTMGQDWAKWKCRDTNLQIPFKLVLGSLGEAEVKELITACAEQLGLAYNHQSKPRCFNCGTDVFSWEQFRSQY